MPFPSRPIAFVLAASNHGSMIVNRNDYHRAGINMLAIHASDPSRGHVKLPKRA